jgi:hypothetical protein
MRKGFLGGALPDLLHGLALGDFGHLEGGEPKGDSWDC